MRQLSEDEVRQVGRLARLELSSEEVHRLTADMNVLLTHFEKLQEIDTSETPPTFHVLELSNVLREDVVAPGLPIEDVVANAPEADGRFFVVPRIVETN